MSEIPEAPWLEVSIDFYGPIYPTNDYLMVLIDEYSRFPMVQSIKSTSAKAVTNHLDTIFGIFGIPSKIRSDNGPPFNSKEFQNFVEFMGINHRLITPEWPRANGMVERFMQNLKKVIQTSKIDKVHWKTRLSEFLRNYRATPHATTNQSPSSLFFRHSNTSRLPQYKSNFKSLEIDKSAREYDDTKKRKIKVYADVLLRTKEHDFKINDYVLVKQTRTNKGMSHYKPIPYQITRIKGNMVEAKSTNDNSSITRNCSFFKKWKGEVELQESVNNEILPIQPIQVKFNSIVLIPNRTNSYFKEFQIAFNKFIDVWNKIKFNELEKETEPSTVSEEKEAFEDAYDCGNTQDHKSIEEATSNLSLETSIREVETQLKDLLDSQVDRSKRIEIIENLEEIESDISNSRLLRTRNSSLSYKENRKYNKKSE